MKCGKLKLFDRKQLLTKQPNSGGPRHYCQKLLVNPTHNEDPRWHENLIERYYCEVSSETQDNNEIDERIIKKRTEDLTNNIYLSVQTLKFTGGATESKAFNSVAYTYKSIPGNHHRMFIKKIHNFDIDSSLEYIESSSHANYILNDYVKKVLTEKETSQPLISFTNEFYNPLPEMLTENLNQNENTVRVAKPKTVDINQENDDRTDRLPDDANIRFNKSDKRKSLTISRTQSPETVQVIRVDVVCNYSGTTPHVSEGEQEENTIFAKSSPIVRNQVKAFNKYMCTKSVKELEENLGGGTKVTLLCKTFKLTTRKKKDL